jgi:hypothetical protein
VAVAAFAGRIKQRRALISQAVASALMAAAMGARVLFAASALYGLGWPRVGANSAMPSIPPASALNVIAAATVRAADRGQPQASSCG